MRPSLGIERSFWKNGLVRVAGVDEAGVGSLSGPVVAAAVVMPPFDRQVPGVRDSKLLSVDHRERLYPRIVRRAVRIAIGAASVAEIERLNILHASRLAMRRALDRLGHFDHALIDGRPIPSFEGIPYTAIVGGDGLCYSIACASIVAKVTRDRLMRRLAARYPPYGWDHNAGYGTPLHLAALREHGITPFHRRGYAPIRALCAGPTE
jgi:ribonuclease HII